MVIFRLISGVSSLAAAYCFTLLKDKKFKTTEDGDFAIDLKGGSVNVLPRRFFLSDPLIENNSAIESIEVELSSGGLEVR